MDDEKVVKLAIKSMIKWGGSGFELAGTAGDGATALKMCERLMPDIIITDLKMPRMDGIELIKRLKAGGYDGEILVLSNYNDFELVKEAMKHGVHDYILKVTVESEDFMRMLGQMAEKLRQKRGAGNAGRIKENGRENERLDCFRKMLDEGGEEAEPGEAARVLEMERNGALQAFIARRDVPAAGQKLSDILRNIVSNVFPSSNWHTVMDIDGSSAFIAVHHQAAEEIASPEKMARRMLELAGMYFNLRLGIVYSNTASDPESFLAELRKCKRAYELMFYKKYSHACICCDLQPVDEDGPVSEAAAAAAEKIYEHILKGEVSDIIEIVENVVRVGARNRLSPHRLKKSIKRLLREAEKRLVKTGICADEALDAFYSDEDVIYAAPSELKLMGALGEIIDRAIAELNIKKKCRKEVVEALRYIEENVCAKITVPEIAKMVSLNDTYFCKVFKSDMGRSIIEYINELKMKKAYELISSGNYLIKEAAAAVGIEDQFYFNRLFKKYYNITPRELKGRKTWTIL